MAKVGTQRAAELTGRSKSTIQRAMNTGRISFETDRNGRRVIDVSELERAYGLVPQGVGAGEIAPVRQENVEAEIKRATELMEMERMKMRIRMLEEQLDSTKEQLDDLKEQRNQWQKQAQQVLLTSQYSQKQAEDLKAELDERDRRAKMRRMQEIESRKAAKEKAILEKAGQGGIAMNKAANQDTEKDKASFQGLWHKIRGEKKSA